MTKVLLDNCVLTRMLLSYFIDYTKEPQKKQQVDGNYTLDGTNVL